MSNIEPKSNYVYQPIGAIGFEHVADPPIYGVGGPDVTPEIYRRSREGMTKSEAQKIADQLNEARRKDAQWDHECAQDEWRRTGGF